MKHSRLWKRYFYIHVIFTLVGILILFAILSIPGFPAGDQRLSTLTAMVGIYILSLMILNLQIGARIFRPLERITRALEERMAVPIPVPAFSPILDLAEKIRDYQQFMHQAVLEERQRAQVFSVLLDSFQGGYLRLDAKGRIQQMNRTVAEWAGCDRETVQGHVFDELFEAGSRTFLWQHFIGWLDKEETFQRTLIFRNQRQRYLLISATPIRVDGQSHGCVLLMYDLTAMHESEKSMMRRLPTHLYPSLDVRTLLFKTLEKLIEEAHRDALSTFSLILIDVDHFRALCMEYGVDAGIEVVQEMVHRLSLPPNGLFFQYGKDEIAVILKKTSVEAAYRWARAFLDRVHRHRFQHGPRLLGVSLSVVGYPRHGQTAAELYETAYYTLLQAKLTGGNRVVVPDQSGPIHYHWRDWMKPEGGRYADLEGVRLEPYYQPIVRLDNETLVGVEVLARLIHEGHVVATGKDIFGPIATLPLSEQVEIDLFLYKQALSFLESFPDLNVFLNFPVLLPSDPSLLEAVIRELVQAGFDLRRIIFEISERSLVKDFQGFFQAVERLRHLGVRLALDDFGSGYASFLYLRMMPIDFVKIDGYYVNELKISGEKRQYLSTFLELAHHHGMRVIAEAVDRAEDVTILKSMGISIIQGNAISPPISRDDFVAIRKRWQSKPYKGAIVQAR